MKKKRVINRKINKKRAKKPLSFRLLVIFSIILILLLILYSYFSFLYNQHISLIYQDMDFGLYNLNTLQENGLDVNLTQISDLPSISITEGIYYPNFVDLDNYFVDLNGLNYIVFDYDIINGSNIELFFNNNDHFINFNSTIGSSGNKSVRIILSYPGANDSISNNFSVNVLPLTCSDNDINATFPDGKNKFVSGLTINQIENITDSCFSNDSVLEHFCYENNTIGKFITGCGSDKYCQNGRCLINSSINHKPEFLDYKCGNINLQTNENRVVKLNECFEDDDGNNLVFGIVGSNNFYIDIKINGPNLSLTSYNNWTGNVIVNIWANDSMQEEIGRVNITVYAPIIVNSNQEEDNTNTEINSEGLVIENAFPSRDYVNIFSNEILNFSIGNKDYDQINWYLNKQPLNNFDNFYFFENPKKGNHTLEVVIKKGQYSTNKTWFISVINNEGLEFAFEVKNILFYIILIVIVIIIFLVVWLFIKEKGSSLKNNYQEEGDSLKIVIKEDKKQDILDENVKGNKESFD